MTPEEFMSLPPSVALGILLDGSAKLKEIVAGAEKPRGPLAPKFDYRLYRKGGFNWASEASLESLTYWLGKKREGAEAGGPYADKDAKAVNQLERWVAYRTWFPNDPWSGTRGDDEGVRAAAPSKSPKLHATEPKRTTYDPGQDSDHRAKRSHSADDYPQADDDDDIPF